MPPPTATSRSSPFLDLNDEGDDEEDDQELLLLLLRRRLEQ
jgi:hypothetical protein